MINSLLGRKRLARTSSTPGRTQAINFFNIDNRWIFVDLPGYGFAKVPKSVRDRWGPMIEEFLGDGPLLKLTILIVDARREPTELDIVMRDYLLASKIAYQTVATKIDKVSPSRRKKSLDTIEAALGGRRVIPYSAATGIGKKELWRIIREV